jgi:HAD superfamily hydrolase (TIGR01490 family)
MGLAGGRMESFAFFDVDHTITRHSTGRRFAFMGARTGMFPHSVLLLIPFYYFFYRRGMMPIKKLTREIPYLKGRTLEEVNAVAMASFEYWIKKDVYTEASALINNLKKRGTRVVLASSSLDILIEPLAKQLGVEESITSKLEFIDGHATGMLTGFPAFGTEKKRFVQDFVEKNGGTLEDASFYSDSINDLPLLEAVGNPVAVNPDPKLKKTALQRGWKILRFR